MFPSFAFAGKDTPGNIITDETLEENLDTVQEETFISEISDAYVVSEMPGLRSESQKHFRMSDGSFIAVEYNETVNYKDSAGKWKTIDNTLTQKSDDDQSLYYEAKNGDEIRQFAASVQDGAPLVRVISKEIGLTMSPAGTTVKESEVSVSSSGKSYFSLSDEEKAEQPSAEQIKIPGLVSEIEYSNIWDGVSLEYVLRGFDVKESIVLEAPREDYHFSFNIELMHLTAAKQADGSVLLLDKNGEIAYSIPAPFMMDAAGETSDAVTYDLKQTENGYILTVSAEKEWLNEKGRTYPVIIDPTIYKRDEADGQTVYTSYVSQGTSAYVENASPAYQNWKNLRCGYYNNSADSHCHGQTIGMLYVNQLPPLPEGCIATQAYLNLLQVSYGGTNNSNYPKLYTSTISEPFSNAETYLNNITWNSFQTQVTYGAPNASGERTALDYFKCRYANNGANYYWDITSAAQAWYGNSNAISRLLVMADGATGNTNARVTFAGYHYPIDATAHRPQIIVGYRNTVGVEGVYSYHSQDAGRAGTGQVNDFTLGLSFSVPLLASASSVSSFSLSLIYNSQHKTSAFTQSTDIHTKAYTETLWGRGWKTSIQQTVVPLSVEGEYGGTDSYLVYTDADGTEHYFKNSSGVWKDEDGLGLEITVSTSGGVSTYTMKDTEDNQWEFYNGYLTEYKDNNGNQLLFAYDNELLLTFPASGTSWKPTSSGTHNITTVWRRNAAMETAVKIATLHYALSDSAQSSNSYYLYSVKDQDKRTITLNYDTSGALTGISFPDQETVSYSYLKYDPERQRYVPIFSATDNEMGYRVEYTFLQTLGMDRVYQIAEYAKTGADTWECGQRMHAYKANANYTRWRFYGTDNTSGTTDDIVEQYHFDNWGRTVNVASFNSDESEIFSVAAGNYLKNEGTSKKNNRMTGFGTGGMQADNLLHNASFEKTASGVSGWSFMGNGSGALRTESGTSACNILPHTGKELMKLYLGSATGTETGYRGVELKANKTYVFSAYVNTACASPVEADGAASLVVLDPNGSEIARSAAVTKNTNTALESGWERLEVAFSVPDTTTYLVCAQIKNITQVVVFDDFKLEEATNTSVIRAADAAASEPELVQVGSFDTLTASGISTSYNNTYWSRSNASTVSVDGTHENVIKLMPTPTTKARATQTINIAPDETACPSPEPNSDSTYLVSAWGKTAPCRLESTEDLTGDNTEKRFFGIIVRINYRGSSTPEYHYYEFNADVGDWQFLTGIVVPKQANQVISTIDVIAACDYCVNSAFVDDISLTKEPVQTYSYDEEGKLRASTQSNNAQSEYEYDSSDRLKSYTSLAGVTTTFTYTGNKRSPTTAKTDQVETTYTYDDSGNIQTTRTEGERHDTVYLESSSVYSDDDNFRTQTTNVNGITSTASYAARSGNTLTSTDANGTLTTYQYNSADRLTRSYITGLTSLTNTYVNGLLTAVSRTGHDNDDHAIRPQVYSMGYDAWGRTTSIKVGSAEGSGLTLASYTYAANGGHLTKTDYANGQSVEYTYDLFDRLIKEAYYNSSHVLQSSNNYVYNSQGVLCRQYVMDAQNHITEEYSLEYDSLGRLIRSKQTDGTSTLQSTEHLYDTANRLTEQSWVLGNSAFTQAYAYNSSDGSLNNTNITGVGNIRFTYDVLKRTKGQIITTKNNSYVFGRWLTYNDSGDRAKTQVSKIRYYAGDEETGSPFTGYTYTYWPDGNIKKIFDATTSQQIAAYEYDAQGQLLSESTPSGTCYYTYDTVGNLLTVQSGSNIVTYTYGDLQWHDRLTRIEFNDREYAISYSGGNPLNWYNGSLYTNLTWGKDRQLVSLKKGTSTYSYSYDMDGVRKSKTVSGVTHNYLTQNGKVVQESYGTKVLQFVYDTAGAPYALRYSTDSGGSWYTFYYILNLQGDVVKLIYANGTACATYSYNAWGECSATTLSTSPVANIANINPLRYRGYYFDSETGFYYLQSRYYDPIVKRFLNADSFASTGQGFLGYNMFAYCENNPVMSQDPTGEIMISTLILIGAAVATYSAVKSRKSGYDWSDTIFYALADGLMAFCAVYTLGMTAYGCYENWCYLNGKTPVTEIGTSTSPVPAVPQEAYDTYDYVSSHNGTPRQGYKGGKVFLNDGRDGGAVLPNSYAPFYEYDIYPKVTGIDRGPERIIISHSGHAAWYTSNHYQSFVRMEIK